MRRKTADRDADREKALAEGAGVSRAQSRGPKIAPETSELTHNHPRRQRIRMDLLGGILSWRRSVRQHPGGPGAGIDMRIMGRCLIILVLGCGLALRTAQAETPEYGTFAFVDPTGTRLLALTDLKHPERVRAALCSGGRRLLAQFELRQEGMQAHDGRDLAYNFHNQPGDVFRLPQGKARADETCFLAEDTLVSAGKLRSVQPAVPADCPQGEQERLALAKRRRVQNCWRIARVSSDKQVLLIEFAREGPEALASIVLVGSQTAIFHDYPAEYRGEGHDLWRVEDAGALHPEDFRVLFVIEGQSFSAIGISWAGSEGESLSLAVAKDGQQFQQAQNGYRYWVPR